MMEVEVEITEEELDTIINWFKIEIESQGTFKHDIDAILNILLMKTCIGHGIPFHVKVIHEGGD